MIHHQTQIRSSIAKQFMLHHILLTNLTIHSMKSWCRFEMILYLIYIKMMRSQRPLKLSKDQELDTHLYSNRSESSSNCLVLLTQFLLSVGNLFVSTTLITLIIVHITLIFTFSYLSYVNLNIYAGLHCKNISESIQYVLRICNWWDIRAIYGQYFKILDVNIVHRWL